MMTSRPSPAQSERATTFAYTGEIVASTPINRVRAKKPPKKIAIFVMSSPGSKSSGTRSVRLASRAAILGPGLDSLQMQLMQENTAQMNRHRPAQPSPRIFDRSEARLKNSIR
jgi:hypothetical protein